MKKLFALVPVFILFGIVGLAQADLITIGTAGYNGSDYNLIWDDNNNGNSVIWLDYSNPRSWWDDQNEWANQLDSQLTYNIDSTYNVTWNETNWRLPKTVNGIHHWSYDGSTTAGFNITTSEMGHLFYEELGNLGLYATWGLYEQPGWGLLNTGDFQNLIPSYYFSATKYSYGPGLWNFHMGNGRQNTASDSSINCALAIRTAQVSTVPEPGTIILFSFGMIGLVGFARKKQY